jgi:ABC-2 type transport system permease protein
MTAFLNHFSFEFKTGLRNRNLLMTNYLMPLVFYVMMGFVMVQINPAFAATLIPSMVVFTVMVSTILGMPAPFTEARSQGIYRSYKINGIPALSILAIPVLTTIFHAMIVSIIITLTGGSIFDGATPESWGAFVIITLLIAFTFGGIGALIGVVGSSTTSVVMLAQIIFIPSILLGGMMIPLELLPAYGRETLIQPGVALIILVVSALLSFGFAVYLFNWDSQNSTRRGNPFLALIALVPYIAGAIYVSL